MDENNKAELYKMYGKAMKMMPGSSNQKELAKKIVALRKKLGMNEERDYKAEYKKFQSSTKSKKYRAELNKYNRKKGTYGNGDGKDASHSGGKIVGFESQSKNRGRAEKSRMKKESQVNELVPPMSVSNPAAYKAMLDKQISKNVKVKTALGNKDHKDHKKAKGLLRRFMDKFKKKKDAPKKSKSTPTSAADFRRSRKESVIEINGVKYSPVEEGFGGELKGKDKQKFEKARKENAEVLGYKVTGVKDIKESINERKYHHKKLGDDYMGGHNDTKGNNTEMFSDKKGRFYIWVQQKGKKAKYIDLPNNIKDRSKADKIHHKLTRGFRNESINEAASWGQVKTFLLGILRKKQATKMDGFRVDLQTANAILQVGNALNQPNQKKYGKLPIRKMARVAWKLIK